MGPSYSARQDANRLDTNNRILAEHDESSTHFNLSSSQARRSRAARFGSSRHVTYASPLPNASAVEHSQRSVNEEDEDEEQLALAYASPTGTSTSSIYLPEYVAWAISQLIAAANDPKLLRADHLKLAHLTDPQEHMAEAAHIPPKRSSLLHLATVSPHRYAAILAVLSEVRQRLSSSSGFVDGSSAALEEALPRWTPDTVLDFDCAAGEGLWAAAQVFRQDDDARSHTSLKQYYGYDRRPNLLKSGKRVAQSSTNNVSPAVPKKPETEVKLKDEGEEIEVDGVTYYEQEAQEADEALEEGEEEEGDLEPALEYFSGPKSAMASVEKTFQSVPLAKDSAAAGSGGRSLAISAFALSLMTNDSNRFEAVQAMWDSGAEVIVIIDQATPRGFASVASARAQLLQLGKRANDGAAQAAHVVAPCSHDKPCPLLHPFAISSSIASAVGVRSDTGNPAKSKDVCGFTARYHTPTFLRRTKHSDRGEENVGYSYVVVKRGPRPSLIGEAQRRGAAELETMQAMVEAMSEEASHTKTGILDLLRNAKKASGERRMLEEVDANAALTSFASGEALSGSVGNDAAVGSEVDMSDEQAMDELLKLLPEAMKAELSSSSQDPNADLSDQLTPEQMDAILATVRSSISPSSTFTSSSSSSKAAPSMDEVEIDGDTISVPVPSAASELAMRLESFSWPRLIKPPLKKGGHVTLDACCASGNIERFTISKASGRQAYQDARKAKWGDLFPHPPRGRSVVKVLNPVTALEYAALQEGVEGEETLGETTEDDLMKTLTLRAPSKLSPSSGSSKKSKGVQVIGLEDGEDADTILRELFEDLDPSSSIITASNATLPVGSTTKTPSPPIDRGIASYRLISPNLVTPTKKQEKRININYAKKWDPSPHSRKTDPSAAARLANTKTNLNTRQTAKPNNAMQQEEGGGERWETEGFQSTLQSASTTPRLRVRRSSRKKSRGDWDQELFGH